MRTLPSPHEAAIRVYPEMTAFGGEYLIPIYTKGPNFERMSDPMFTRGGLVGSEVPSAYTIRFHPQTLSAESMPMQVQSTLGRENELQEITSLDGNRAG